MRRLNPFLLLAQHARDKLLWMRICLILICVFKRPKGDFTTKISPHQWSTLTSPTLRVEIRISRRSQYASSSKATEEFKLRVLEGNENEHGGLRVWEKLDLLALSRYMSPTDKEPVQAFVAENRLSFRYMPILTSQASEVQLDRFQIKFQDAMDQQGLLDILKEVCPLGKLRPTAPKQSNKAIEEPKKRKRSEADDGPVNKKPKTRNNPTASKAESAGILDNDQPATPSSPKAQEPSSPIINDVDSPSERNEDTPVVDDSNWMDSSSDEDIALTYMKQRGDDDDNDDDWMASSRDSDREEVGIPAAHLDDEQQHTDPGKGSRTPLFFHSPTDPHIAESPPSQGDTVLDTEPDYTLSDRNFLRSI